LGSPLNTDPKQLQIYSPA